MNSTFKLSAWMVGILLLPCFLNAQVINDTYAENEFVVVYDRNASEAERQEMRDLYGVTQYQSLFGGYIEVWQNLIFPITVVHDDGTVTIQNIDELELDINVSSLGDTDPRARVSDGDFNYEITLDDDPNPVFVAEENSSPLFYCEDNNYRIFGEPRYTDTEVHIVIFDQVVNHPELHANQNPVLTLTDNPGGTHANKVASIIDDILNDQGLENVTFTSFGVFGADGTASYVDLLVGFHTLQALDIRNAIVNFSANLTFTERDIIDGNLLARLAAQIVAEQNLLLISSAGNDSSTSNAVFPGCFELPNEITVVGTGRCFTQLSSFSNTNGLHYEIAVEAEEILANDGTSSFLVKGTSFAAPLVTAAAAQISMGHHEFSSNDIQEVLLMNADYLPALDGAVQNNRILNTYNACMGNNLLQGETEWDGAGAIGLDAPSSPIDLSTAPNPFVDELSVQLPFDDFSSPTRVSVIGVDGRIWRNAELLATPTLQLPELPRGVYLLEVERGNERWVQRIVKQ